MCEDVYLSLFLRRELGAFRGVGTQELLLCCFSQRGADDDPHLADGGIGHSRAVDIAQGEPAVLLLVAEEGLDILLGEL